MFINTKLLGEVEIQESEIFTFEEGLLGFPEYKKFALLGLDPDLPIAMLQSIDSVDINFVVGYPFAFKKDFSFEISEEDKQALQIVNEEEVITYSIVTLKDTFTESTLNLLAPVIINASKKLGKQIVLNDNEKYSLQFPIGAFVGSEK